MHEAGSVEARMPMLASISVRKQERLFFSAMALACALTVFGGFARTYYLKAYFQTPALPLLLHLHGAAFTAWMILLVVQTSLVAAGQVRLHRRLGMAGGGLAILMVLVGVAAALRMAALGRTPPGGPPPLSFLVVPLGDILLFAGLVGAALYYRRRPDIHKRLMLAATIAMLSAAVGRLPFAFLQAGPVAFYTLTDLFFVPCFAFDMATRGRPHRATVWSAVLVVGSQPTRLWLAGTPAWLLFAEWLTQWAA